MKNLFKVNYLKTSNYLKIVTITGLLFFANQNEILAQFENKDDLSKVNIYLDIGALPIGQASINVERRLSSGDKVTWYGRAGLGAGTSIGGEEVYAGLAAITMLTGKNNNHFEMNGGTAIGFDNVDDKTVVWPVIDLGYRYQKPAGGFIFRAKAGTLGIGIGLGYAF